MKAELDHGAGRLELRFDTREEFLAFLKSTRDEQGFLVPLSQPPRLHEQWRVRLSSGSLREDLQAHVAQIFAFADQPSKVAFLLAAAPTADSPDTDTSESRGSSPIHELKQMNPNERARVAYRAGRSERQILLRDRSAKVLEALLGNPQIDAEGVLVLARSPHVTSALLQRIAQDSRWGKNQEIQSAIARNPKAPSTVVIRILPTIRTNDLRTMARIDAGFRENIRKAALKEYMRRTGQRQ